MCSRFRVKSVDSHMFYTQSVFMTLCSVFKIYCRRCCLLGQVCRLEFFFLFSDTIENVWVPIFPSVLNPEGLQVPYEKKL